MVTKVVPDGAIPFLFNDRAGRLETGYIVTVHGEAGETTIGWGGFDVDDVLGERFDDAFGVLTGEQVRLPIGAIDFIEVH